MTSCMRMSRALDNPPVLIACSPCVSAVRRALLRGPSGCRTAPSPRPIRASSSAGASPGALRLPLRVLGRLRTQALLLFPELRRELGAEILRLEHRTDLDLGPAVEGCPREPP